jgi:hypothetical protein
LSRRRLRMKITMRTFVMTAVLIMAPLCAWVQAYEFKGIDIRGFVSQGFLLTSDNNVIADSKDGTTQFNEAGINFSANASEQLRIGVQIFARDYGTIGNDEVKLDWAVADYHWKDPLSLMAGQMKMVMGLYNETRDLDMLRTFILLPQSVYNEGWRDSSSSIQGVGLYGDIPMSELGTLNYDVQYGTVNLDPDGAPGRLLEDQWPFGAAGLSVDVDRCNVKRMYAGSVRWITGLDGLVLGVSGWSYNFEADARTELDTTNPAVSSLFDLSLVNFDTRITVPDTGFDVSSWRFIGSLEYTWRDLVLAVEYSQIRYDIEMSNDLFAADGPFHAAVVGAGLDVDSRGTVTIPTFSSEGYYASVTYRFCPLFEMGTYYSVYYPDKDDRNGDERVSKGLDTDNFRAWLKDACVTTRFDLTENWILKLEAHKMNGAAVLLKADNPVDPDTGEQFTEDWYLYAAKVTFSF